MIIVENLENTESIKKIIKNPGVSKYMKDTYNSIIKTNNPV